MAMKNPYAGFNQYKQNNIMQASPEELTLMLYNGVIKFLKQGKLYIEAKDMQKSHNSIMRGNAIITELNSTLDMKYDVSKNLRQLYDYMSRRLVYANMEKDQEILDEVIEICTELRDAWKEAMKIAKGRK